MREKQPLHAYQRKAIETFHSEKTIFFAVDMGLGKTRICLEFIRDMGLPALVLAPLKVCHLTWPEEIEKWTPELSYRVIHGPNKFREAKAQPDIHIINYEGLKWWYQKMRDGNLPQHKYPIVIIDESSKIKNPKSQRFKLLKAMEGLFGEYRACLSATPMPNGFHELWSQMYMLDQGVSLGQTISQFQRQYFHYTGPPRYELLPRDGAEAEITERVRHKFFRLEAEDYLELPPIILREIKIQLPTKVKKLYKDFKRDSIVELGTLEEKNQLTAVSAGAACMKLRQIVQGAVYTDEGTQVLHDRKVSALKALQEETEGAPILVACQFKFEVAMLRKAFGDFPVIVGGVPAATASAHMRRWNAGKVPLLVCHPAAISHGVNLQDGGWNVVWYGLPWSLEQYIQFIGRLHRQGQPHGVVVHHILAEGTMDTRVLAALNTKNQTQQGFLAAIKEAIYD